MMNRQHDTAHLDDTNRTAPMRNMGFGFAMHNPMGQAYRLLYVGFIVAPILFGLDKFFNLMTDWTRYLAPAFPNAVGVTPEQWMYGVGAIEVLAGIFVAFMPRFGGYVVAAWLWGIIFNLFVLGGYWDITLRDFGLSLGALALARLAQARYMAARAIENSARDEPVSYGQPRLVPTDTTERRAA